MTDRREAEIRLMLSERPVTHAHDQWHGVAGELLDELVVARKRVVDLTDELALAKAARDVSGGY